MTPKVLSEEEVLRIHYALVEEFSKSGDPIDPPGVKDKSMLGSAVSRQLTSIQGIYKYPEPISNAATLTYGLCNDHPFHNGNKRTALVAMIVHLHKNGYVLVEVRHKDLYNMILSVANHKIAGTQKRKNRKSKYIPNRPSTDVEIEALTNWIDERVKKIQKGEKQITYRQLRAKLKRFTYELERPNKGSIELVRYETKQRLFSKPETVRIHVAGIPFPGDNSFVSMSAMRHIRRICNLQEEQGVDSDAFYNDGAVIDAFINDYRQILDRLANK